MIREFIEKFTKEEVIKDDDIYQLGTEWYRVPDALIGFKNLPRTPVWVGQFLGRERNKYLVPGKALLDAIAPVATKRVMVSDKAAWLFVCGKDVLQQSIIRVDGNPKSGEWVLVMQGMACIGFGEVQGALADKTSIVKNLFDLGDFLRRERPTKPH